MSEVEEELELSQEAFSDYRHMEEVSLRRRYITLYFSLYHAVRSLLISKGYAPKTHSGQDSLVHNILLTQEEVLSDEEAATYSKLRTRREQADYEADFLGTERELERLEEKVRELLGKLEQEVENQ